MIQPSQQGQQKASLHPEAYCLVLTNIQTMNKLQSFISVNDQNHNRIMHALVFALLTLD